MARMSLEPQRSPEAVTELEARVMGYAEAMTATPPETIAPDGGVTTASAVDVAGGRIGTLDGTQPG